jgi:5-methylcytosine-specific restriction endonuclease McrBC regulatory subunit McrC
LAEGLKNDNWKVWSIEECKLPVYEKSFFSRYIIPDIVLQRNANGKEQFLIFDAKYKRIDSGIQRNDLFQIIAYMHTLPKEGALIGGLIYPSETSQEPTARTLNGYNGTLLTLPLEIPRSNDYATFRNEMDINSRVLVEMLNTEKLNTLLKACAK